MAPTRSPHFDAVSAQLHLGGTVYAYADIEGDMERATDFFLGLLRDLPELVSAKPLRDLSARRVIKILGLDSLRAVGLSSYETDTVYQNRSFLHYQGERKGLLAFFGQEPAPFDLLSVAPDDADLAWDQQLDLGVLLDIVRGFGELGLGMTTEELDQALEEDPFGLGMSLGEILSRLRTKFGLILSVDEARSLQIPGESFRFPYTDLLFRVDGLGDLGDALIRRAALDPFIAVEQTERHLVVRPAIQLPPPWNAYEPAIIKESATGRMYLVSSSRFLERCLDADGDLTQSRDFNQAFGQLPSDGNGLMYFSPRLTRVMHALLDRVIEANGATVTTSVVRFLLPDVGYPVGWVAQNRSDGLLVASSSPSSHKSTLLTIGYAALLPAAAVFGVSLLEAGEPTPELQER